MKWILASASPRRKELIAHICREFEIKVADADETVADTDCAQTVQTLALRKALAIGGRKLILGKSHHGYRMNPYM